MVGRRIAGVIAMALLVGCGAAARFSGHGYSLQVPTNPEFSYRQETSTAVIQDEWAVKSQPAEAFGVTVVDPLPSDWPSTLDGALAQAQAQFAIMDYTDPTVTTVNLPAGSADQLDATGTLGAVRMYAFYKGNKYFVVDFAGVPPPLMDQIINSFTLN